MFCRSETHQRGAGVDFSEPLNVASTATANRAFSQGGSPPRRQASHDVDQGGAFLSCLAFLSCPVLSAFLSCPVLSCPVSISTLGCPVWTETGPCESCPVEPVAQLKVPRALELTELTTTVRSSQKTVYRNFFFHWGIVC